MKSPHCTMAVVRTNKHRPEYGELVELKTESVDASPFVENLKGFKAKLRKWYWGFGPKEFPLNGRVWYPKDEGPFALVLVVHGNHQMEEHSDPGYGYLGELLASRGFIMVSVDENFLNISWSGDIGSENDARGWILLKHLSLWRDWNEAEGNPFYGKVDLSNIALVGHSRGGEAIMHAAAFNMLEHYPDDANVRFDFGFEIKSLIGIAPIDGQYMPASTFQSRTSTILCYREATTVTSTSSPVPAVFDGSSSRMGVTG